MEAIACQRPPKNMLHELKRPDPPPPHTHTLRPPPPTHTHCDPPQTPNSPNASQHSRMVLRGCPPMQGMCACRCAACLCFTNLIVQTPSPPHHPRHIPPPPPPLTECVAAQQDNVARVATNAGDVRVLDVVDGVAGTRVLGQRPVVWGGGGGKQGGGGAGGGGVHGMAWSAAVFAFGVCGVLLM
jgi:hypothetical protein